MDEPLSRWRYRLHGFYANQLHWWDVVCGLLESKIRGSHFQGVTVAIDMLGNIVWIVDLARLRCIRRSVTLPINGGNMFCVQGCP